MVRLIKCSCAQVNLHQFLRESNKQMEAKKCPIYIFYYHALVTCSFLKKKKEKCWSSKDHFISNTEFPTHDFVGLV